MRALTIALCLLATPARADVAGVASVIDGDNVTPCWSLELPTQLLDHVYQSYAAYFILPAGIGYLRSVRII